MLNLTSNKIKISSVGTTIFFSAFLSGCTGLAVSNKEPVSLVQGPAITDIFTPFDMALSCLKGQIRNDVNFSVGAILDQTGKDVVTDGGTGKLVTQGAGDMVQSALFRAGVSLLNRRDPRIIESEAKWGIRDPRMIQASNYYVTGSINSLDFIPGGGFDMQIGGVGPNYSQTRIIVGLDLSLTDARTSKVVGNVSLQKQIVAQDYGISAGRFAGRTLLNIQIGKGEREATNFALRQMLNLATFELLSQVVPPSTFEGCRNTIPPEFGRLSLTQSSVALYKYKETQQQKTPVTSGVTESSLTKTNPSTEKINRPMYPIKIYSP
ncbi:CsgG/HfaB family protein [Acinetobacter soli]|nr:CsgG/HfaB family protein [Acinetobacter soli]